MHPFVIAQPEVSERTLSSKDKVLILGSDGVWDRINSQEVRQAMQHISILSVYIYISL